MSIVDLPVAQGGPSEGMGRTPPQDVAAEQSALGGMMLSKDAIADVIEVLRSNDFYRPAHELIYEAVLDLYSRGEPADAVTVADELTKRGELSRVGGLAYIHTLISSVPTAANAGYYARIVRERAVLRRLVEAGTRIVQLGYGGADGRGGGDVDEIVNSAQAEVYAVTQKRTAEDYAPLAEVIEGAIDEIEASSHRGDGLTGVPTGFADLDQLTNGLHPGQMIVIAARPAMGKALALDTPLATPGGWTTMGEVSVGDNLIGADGRPTRVVAATAVMVGRTCYEVVFSDGSTIVADAQHQWLTETREYAARVRTTEQVRDILGGPTQHVAPAAPLQFPDRELPQVPYVLGARLGDGTTASTTTADPGVVMRLEAQEAPVTPAELTGIAAPRVPSAYLRASERQRRDLLAGVLDTRGEVAANGTVQVALADPDLALDVAELLVSLGYRAALAGSEPAVILTFAADDDVFQLESKRLLHKERRPPMFQRRDSLFIADVRPVESVPVRCVEVDNDDHLYLAGRSMIPTHNSTLGLDIARAASIHHGMASVMFSLEMGRNEITMRLLSAEARIPLQNMRKGTMREDDWTRLAKTMGDVSEAPFFIDDSPNMSLMEIRAKCRRLKQRHDLKLVVIDYLQLMTSGKRVESRQQEVSEFSRALKLLAKEIQVPVIALSQLNRGPEQRSDKKPQMSDLRESGCLTADTRVLRADTGGEVTMGELYASGAKNVPVWSLDSSLRYVRRHLTHVFPTGRRPVFRVRMSSGKGLRVTANHPFLTYEGWRPIGELATGARVAVPRHVMAPETITAWEDEEISRLAQALADSSVGEDVPAAVFALPQRQISLFLRTIWRSGASTEMTIPALARYESASRPLLEGVARLLLRFGISCVIAESSGRWMLEMVGGDDRRRFFNEVALSEPAVQPPSASDQVPSASVTTSGSEVWERVRCLLSESVSGRPKGTSTARRQPLGRVAALLDDAQLEIDAVNDVFWDTVLAVEPDGEEEVYDATVVGNHNFIANGIAVHNSIEQDADMVILLHREDAYEKESPRAGEADFIVAKHRNGPTDTITVAFQGHYSRFVDMAT